jgi:adenine-specific DNA-methyltransferase
MQRRAVDEATLPILAVVEAQDTVPRRIGNNPPPPLHSPTKAVPDGLLEPVPAEVVERNERQADELVAAMKSRLGAPFFSAHGFVLYKADCLDVLAALEATRRAVDLTVTSPPYNIGKDYETPLPLDGYLDWAARRLRAIHSVTASNGALWLNLGYVEVPGSGRAVPLSYLLWNRSPFFLQQEVVWNYGAGVASKRLFSPRNEKWLFLTRSPDEYVFNLDLVRDPNVKYPNQKKKGKFRCNPLGKNPSDVWQIPKVTTGKDRSSKERTAHPAQFPLALVDRIVKVSSNPADVVFDPFTGSGSSGLAALGNGRTFVGVELRDDYCNMTVRRVEDFVRLRRAAQSQPSLYSPRG